MFKKFLYYFLTEDGRSYYTDGKLVKTSAVPKPLEQTPDGWQEISIGYERDLKKLGILRSFTLPLSTVKTIRRILRTIVFTKNLEEKIYLLIQRLATTSTDTTYRRFYKYLYKGKVDLSQFRYEDTIDQFSLLEAGIYQQVRANEGTTYELDIDSDPEVVRVKMDGFHFSQAANWIIPGGMQWATFMGGFPLAFVNLDGTSTGSVFATDIQRDAYFLKNVGDSPVDITLNGEIRFVAGPLLQEVRLRLAFANGDGAFISTIREDLIKPATENTLYSVGYTDLSLTIPAGQTLTFFVFTTAEPGAPGDHPEYITLQETRFKASFQTKYRDTFVNALKPSTVLKRLMNRITGTDGNCDTTYTEQFDHLVLLSGDALRGLTGPKLKTSLNSFTDFMRIVAGAGQGIENDKLFFQQYTYFFNSADPIELGEVRDLKVYPAVDLLGNTVKIGYPEQKIDEVNGKLSFNNTHLYTSPITNPVKELNYVCSYISDPFYIETTRINLDGKTTTDSEADNDVFILNTQVKQQNCDVVFSSFGAAYTLGISGGAALLDYLQVGTTFQVVGVNAGTYKVTGSGVDATGLNLIVFVDGVFNTLSPDLVNVDLIFGTRILRRVVYDSISGVPDTALIFNIEGLTPKRLVLLQANMLNSLFYGFAGQKLTFQTTEKNADLVTTKDGVTIREKADYVIGTDLLFKPWYFELDTRVPVDLIDLLEATPQRCFSFTWYGYTYKGFLVKAGISPNDNRFQSYKLLCTPDTDLTQLID